MSGTGKKQSKCVTVYWTPDYLARLDELCGMLSVRRNDFIKAAVLEKESREMKKLSAQGIKELAK